MRRTALAAVALALCASSLVLASPAHAADYAVDCNNDSSSTLNVTLVVGATYTIENVSGSDSCFVSGAGGSVSWVSSAGGSPNPSGLPTLSTLTVTGIAMGSETLTLTTDIPAPVYFNFTVVASDAGGSPPSVMQQFGKPASSTCDASQPAGLDWAGVPSGGWANSWSQWMNGGTGGFVCTRTLIYSSTQEKWVLA